MSRARSALRARWLKLRPRTDHKTAKGARLWFLPSLWFLGELVVFCRLCGFWASLWFFGAFHFPSPTDPYSRAHLTHIDEDALEGVYFAFSLILRCLPYFCRKTRPRASYDLIRAHSRVLACGSRVVLACGFVVLWSCGSLVVFGSCVAPMRVRNGKSCQNPRASASFRRYYQRGAPYPTLAVRARSFGSRGTQRTRKTWTRNPCGQVDAQDHWQASESRARPPIHKDHRRWIGRADWTQKPHVTKNHKSAHTRTTRDPQRPKTRKVACRAGFPNIRHARTTKTTKTT